MSVAIKPQPEDAPWKSEAWQEWWQSLDHSMCSLMSFEQPFHKYCRSIHCPKCGKSTGPQGHMNRDGSCPVVSGMRDAWPWDNTTEKMVPF